MSQRFTLDRQSFEQFIAAVSLFQSMQHAAAKKIHEGSSPLPLYLLDTLRGVDAGTLVLQAGLERVAELALHIVGGDRAVLWLFTSEKMIRRAAAGLNFEEERVCAAVWSKLQSGGAFGENPPPKLDLTRTLEKYSGSVGSSLAIAILPGGRIAGTLAAFSSQSMPFTERHYANLRLLAGLAQYILTKNLATRNLQDSADDSLTNPESHLFLEAHQTSAVDRSARTPLISHGPVLAHLQPGQIENGYVPAVVTPVPLGPSLTERRQTETEHRSSSLSLSTSLPAPVGPAIWETVNRWQAAVLGAVRNSLGGARGVRANWILLRQAIPAFAIMAVMSFFVGLLTGGRQPLVGNSLSVTAEAATTPVPIKARESVEQKPAAMPAPKKSTSTAVPIETSHLRFTDRETAATISEMSKFEVRNLRRAADYGDDQAALQLGMLYELGRGFPQSCTKATKLVLKAAGSGNADAEYNLGLRYRDGDGVEANLQKAETWLRRALAHKNSNAQRALQSLPSHHPEATPGQM